MNSSWKRKTRDVKENPAKIIGIALFLMYLISGVLLLFLALLLYKMELHEAAVKIGIILIYIITGLFGGIFAGKKLKDKKFLWGTAVGFLYFVVLFCLSFAIKRQIDVDAVKTVTTLILCSCAGMAGGMIS